MIAIHRRACLHALAVAPIGLSSTATQGRGPTLLSRYVEAWTRRDLAAIIACMHPDVIFVGPNVNANGRDGYAASTQRFLGLLEQVTVRARCEGGDDAMIAYDFVCRPPIGRVPTAELVNFRDGLIGRSEIFFDTRLFPTAPSAAADRR